MDPYAVLGVDRSASPVEIDAAYAGRRRVHDPASQTDRAARIAALRYQADLGTAYRQILGTDPPTPGAAAAGTTEVPTRGRPTSSTGRDWLLTVVTLVAASLLIRIPVALGFGLGGAVVGWLAAVGVCAFAVVHVRRRRS